jgi:hypothetical protein
MDAACFVIDLIAKFSCTQPLCFVRIACVWPTTSITGAARGGYKTAVWLEMLQVQLQGQETCGGGRATVPIFSLILADWETTNITTQRAKIST